MAAERAERRLVHRVELVTGGFSEDEALLGRVERGSMFSAMFWSSTHRGGLLAFEVPVERFDSSREIAWLDAQLDDVFERMHRVRELACGTELGDELSIGLPRGARLSISEHGLDRRRARHQPVPPACLWSSPSIQTARLPTDYHHHRLIRAKKHHHATERSAPRCRRPTLCCRTFRLRYQTASGPRSGETGAPSTPGSTPAGQRPTAEPPSTVKTKIIRVVDGDTVAVEAIPGALDANGDDESEQVVRLLGIDGTETHYRGDGEPECGAKAATDHLGGILPQDLPVIVEFDARGDRTDRYGRSLAYVATPAGNDAGRQQVIDGYEMPWYPRSEPEPSGWPTTGRPPTRPSAGTTACTRSSRPSVELTRVRRAIARSRDRPR